jgi:hypothetical protein
MHVKILLVPFSFLEKFIQDLQIIKTVPGCPVGFGPQFFITDVFQCLFGCFRVIPEIGGGGQFFFFLNGKDLIFDVKGTSSGLQALTEALLYFRL